VSDAPYFQRFGFCERQILIPPSPALAMAVVIPCFNEPDLIGSLESLWACDRPSATVEIIVVINSSTEDSESIRLQNLRTLQLASEWSARHHDSKLQVHLLHFPRLPAKHAGVGLARKIGMDEAARRFDDLGRSSEGIIICFDADCRCEWNYLGSIERHFRENPRSPGCSIYFEHPLEGPLDPEVYEAIAVYELHLRYYVQALRYAGFPYAQHTIGSCMAVRAGIYKKQGGMNRRQAGEDFYFLHKVMPLGGFTDLTETKVIPSPRDSDRVPFGTGRAVRNYLVEGTISTYPLEAFLDLKMLFDLVPAFCQSGNISKTSPAESLPESLRTFLDQESFSAALKEILENTSTDSAFRKRFFQWFNGFQVMKFVHYARDHVYGGRSVAEEARRLLHLLVAETNLSPNAGTQELLSFYRQLDREAGSFRSRPGLT
jgi:hypothetical protein